MDIMTSSELQSYAGLSCDSRKVADNFIFICIKGNNSDGHDYIENAIKSGAKLILIEEAFININENKERLRELRQAYPAIEFEIKEDNRITLAKYANKFYGEPSKSLNIYGITGTNGKTTITHLIQELFEVSAEKEEQKKCSLIGTIGIKDQSSDKYNDIGNTTPSSEFIQAEFKRIKDKGIKLATMEVSSHALDQKRCLGINFRHAVVINLSQDHLDYHRTMKEYMLAKAAIFKQVTDSAILNLDDDYYEDFRKEADNEELKVFTFGINSDEADLKAEDIKISEEGISYKLKLSEKLQARTKDYSEGIKINLKLNGTFNVYNSLAAILLGILEGLSLKSIADNSFKLNTVAGRFETIFEAGKPTCIVDYAHSPDGLKNILKGARDLVNNSENLQKLVCVFGCGGDRDITKRPQMGRIAFDLADRVYVSSDNPRSERPSQIIADILTGFPSMDKTEVIENRATAIASAIKDASVHDLVVIAGKGHEDYQILGDATIHFDDREHVREALAKYNNSLKL